MIRKLLKIIATTTIMLLPLVQVGVIHADTAKDAVCQGIGLTSNGNGCDTSTTGSPTVESMIHTVISIISYMAGIIAVIMVVMSGYKYMTAGGDSAKVTAAKNTLMHALIGLAIAALAQALVLFVFKTASS